MIDRKLPPVAELAMLSLALIMAGGIYLSAHLPRAVPLGPAVALLAASVVVLAVNITLLMRVDRFAWGRFFLVFRWAFLAYLIIAGMLLYAFLRDHIRGGTLVVLIASLVVYAVHIPLLMGFTVARYHNPDTDDPKPDSDVRAERLVGAWSASRPPSAAR